MYFEYVNIFLLTRSFKNNIEITHQTLFLNFFRLIPITLLLTLRLLQWKENLLYNLCSRLLLSVSNRFLTQDKDSFVLPKQEF